MTRRIASLVLVALIGVVAAACSSDEPAAVDTGTDAVGGVGLPGADDAVVGTSVADVALPDVSAGGETFAMRAKPDEALIVYFGFTYCPDICPTTLSDVRFALGDLGDLAERVEVAVVTVDPDRDTPDVLTRYVHAFVPDGHALRTDDQAELDAAGDAFGATFEVISLADGGVDVSHTAYLYAVDDEGIVRIVWPFGAEPETIASDLTDLLG